MAGLGIGDVVLRLSVATVFGLLVGLDRERRERAAGIRTMALVGLGAALFSMSSAYALDSLAAAQQHVALDPSRIAAQIVSGIGFLGAGVIFLRRDAVRGLTTAAALWVVAAIGMACGFGYWAAGIAGVVLALLVLAGVRPVERLIFPQHGPQRVLIHMDSVEAAGDAIPRVRTILAEHDVQMDRLSLRPAKRGGELITLRCRIKRPDDLADALRVLRRLPGVSGVQADVRVPGTRSGGGKG